jgi:hypothetical protein
MPEMLYFFRSIRTVSAGDDVVEGVTEEQKQEAKEVVRRLATQATSHSMCKMAKIH